MPATRLVMILGFQRSGTTALFDTLASAPGVSPRHEHADDDLYDDYFLRPEPQIRSVLAALPGTVLLKPVRESRRRSPLEVAKEYRDYDLSISRYKEAEIETVEYDPPKVILERLAALDAAIAKGRAELEEMLR